MAKKSRNRASVKRGNLELPEVNVVAVSVPCQSVSKSHEWGMAAVIVTLCAALYGWTAHFPLVFDDYFYMRENPFFKEFGTMPFFTDFNAFVLMAKSQGLDPDLSLNIALRPLAYATLYLNFILAGGFDPWGFRVLNILFHALNGCFLFQLVMQLAKAMAQRNRWPQGASPFFIASVSALLFTVHPLATESVTYIIQRFTSMGATFFLLAVLLHVISLTREGEGSATRRVWWRFASVLCAIASMLTKEDAVMVPVIAVMLDWLVIGSPLRRALWRGLPLLLCLPLVPLLVMASSAALHEHDWSPWRALNVLNRTDMPWGRMEYPLTQLTVVVEYLRLLLWPTGQNVLPYWPSYESMWQWPVLRSGLLLGVLVTAIAWWRWWGLRVSSKADHRALLAWASLCWFFAIIMISSGPVPLPDLISEHRTYLPSIGIFILIACVLDRLRDAVCLRGLRRQWMVTVGVAAAVLGLSIATCMRNEVWRTNISLWTNAVLVGPERSESWSNLGVAQAEAGLLAESERSFRQAVELEPRFVAARVNLTSILLKMERWDDCVETTQHMLEKEELRREATIHYNQAAALAGMGKLDEAVTILKMIVSQRPDHFLSHRLLGVVYHHYQHRDRAAEHLRHAQTLLPGDPEVTRLLQAMNL
ncbi:MAG: tetratricopeptide repeat protein [Verrucomicrobiaceae bacterium]|nr:tetratricopeptide repeat protein [Verrucomicrobiaceae bacterium]